MKYTFFEIKAEYLFMDKPDVIASELKSHLKKSNLDKSAIVKIECWLSISGNDEYVTSNNTFYTALAQCFDKKLPAALLLAQSPVVKAKDNALLKVTYSNKKDTIVEHKQFQKHPYTTVLLDNERLIFSGGIMYNQENDTLRSVQGAYDFAEQLLDHEEMHFGQICHQWNYMEHLDSTHTDPHTGWNNYQVVNEIRDLYFDPTLFKHGYPLQSCTGIDRGGFITDFVAASKEGFPTVQIKSAVHQVTNAIYLPALREAHIVSDHSNTDKSESVSGQTLAVVGEFNNQLKLCNLKAGLVNEAKVFLKNMEDLEVVSTIIEETLQPESVVYLQASTKNDDLLISIEGIIRVEV